MQVTKATPQHSSLNSQTSGSSMKPLAISPSPPEPPRISPTITFISGCASGALARMATNSPRDIASSLQSSKSVSYDPKNLANRCISKKNLTSCTFGTSLQYATLYGLQSLMHDKNDSASMKMAKDAVCAIAGGLVIHPSTVAFYHQDSDPLKSGAQNQLKLLKEKPMDFTRGIVPRMLASSSQWVSFFAAKDAMLQKGYSDEQARSMASLIGVGATTPFYQAYAYQCRNGGSTQQAFIKMSKMLIQRPNITMLFAVAAASEMYLGDLLKDTIEKSLNTSMDVGSRT